MSKQEWVAHVQQFLPQFYGSARTTHAVAQEELVNYYNRNNGVPSNVTVGDWVLVQRLPWNLSSIWSEYFQ